MRRTCLVLVAAALCGLLGVTSGADGTSEPYSCDVSGYITFAINVHDIVNIEESAETILRLIDIYEAYGVRGDFYITGAMVNLYEEQRPDVIERLRDSEMTISYHVRAPHPLTTLFTQPFDGRKGREFGDLLLAYETYRLDLTTGGLLEHESGGYTHSHEVFGRPPVTACFSAVRLRDEGLPVYALLGAKVTVTYHETGTDPDQPFEWVGGLLVRPSDFSITRWPVEGRSGEPFWWNMLTTDYAAQYDPVGYLGLRLAAWSHPRPPFVTALVHENNFYRKGATPWANVYYADAAKTAPKAPPYDLNAPDTSVPRGSAGTDAMWEAYAALVAYAAEHLIVVTSEDIAAIAESYAGCAE